MLFRENISLFCPEISLLLTFLLDLVQLSDHRLSSVVILV